MARKAQAWYMDFVAGMLIFVIGLSAYYFATQNISTNDERGFEDLSQKADSLSAQLMTLGYPMDWNNITAEKIGVVSGQRLDAGKWAAFSGIPYNESKRIFGSEYGFFAFISEKNGTIAKVANLCGIGDPAVDVRMDGQLQCLPIGVDALGHKNLVRKERYVFYEDRIVKVVVFMWG